MNSNGNWVLQVDPVVYKFLRRIPVKTRGRILRAIEELPQDPFRGDIQKLGGSGNFWRRRIGSYRIKYELITAEKVIHVFRAERRTSQTY